MILPNSYGWKWWLLGCIYRSPAGDQNVSATKLCQLLRAVADQNPTHLVIVGDFNYPEINWSTWSSTKGENHHSQYFTETLQDCFLFQHVTEPTRFRPGSNPRPLDLILSNEDGMITNLECLPGLGRSDHVCLRFTLNCYTDHKLEGEATLNYKRGDYVQINKHLEDRNWERELEHMDLRQAWDHFSYKYAKLLKDHIPRSNPRKKPKNMYMTREAMKLKKRKLLTCRPFKSRRQAAIRRRLKSVSLPPTFCQILKLFLKKTKKQTN